MRPYRALSRPSHAIAGLALCCASVAGAQTAAIGEIRAARQLDRGIVLVADDMTADASVPASALPLGWVTRRVVREGETLRAPAIGRLPVVTPGVTVMVRVPTARVLVTREAVVLAEGGRGDTVLVRLDRRTSVPAVVLDSATVTLVAPTPR